MNVPIVFFHRGYDPYIAFTLWQARQTNPSTPIYLVGDEQNDLSRLGIEHVHVRDYGGRRDEFLSVYQHFSEHELECERLCIERWFHLSDFVEQHRLDQFVYLDSDVFLLMDLAPLLPTWREYDVAGIPGFYGACYFSRRRLLGEFCEYVLALYRDTRQVAAWREAFEQSRGRPLRGGYRANVSDMSLSRMFLDHHQARCLDLRQPRGGMVFNGNFLRSERDVVPVAWGSDRRELYATVDGQYVRLIGLHFVGWSKRYLSAFTGWPAPLVRCFLKPNYRRNLKKLAQHIYFGRQFRRTMGVVPPDRASRLDVSPAGSSARP